MVFQVVLCDFSVMFPYFRGLAREGNLVIFPILRDFPFRGGSLVLSRQGKFPTLDRATLKGTNLRGQTPICNFLRVPAIFCGFLRKSAVFCENLRVPNALFSRKRRESAKISENQRKSAFGLGLSPQVRPLKRALTRSRSRKHHHCNMFLSSRDRITGSNRNGRWC